MRVILKFLFCLSVSLVLQMGHAIAQPAPAPVAGASTVLEVKKVSVRGYKDLYLIKHDMTLKDAVALFSARGAKLATASDARDLQCISDAAVELKVGAPIDLRITNKVFMAADKPFKFPSRKAEADELKRKFASFNFSDGIESGYVVIGEAHKEGHFYRGRPDDWVHTFWFVTAADPLKLSGKK